MDASYIPSTQTLCDTKKAAQWTALTSFLKNSIYLFHYSHF
jgi:hypothetical protein